MKIVIPTYKRAGNVTAVKNLPDEVLTKYYWLAVRPEEEAVYREAYPTCNVFPLEGDVEGVTPTRQRINEQFTGKIIVIDDDVRFITTTLDIDKSRFRGHKYCISGKSKIKTLEEYDEMAECLDKEMDINPFGGLMSLGFKQDYRKFPKQWNRPIIWAVWFNLDKFDPYKYDYTEGPEFIEDVYMSIRWFDEGNDFPCMTGPYAITKSHGTGDQDGGCNDVENRSKSHNASAKWLEDNYPQYCWQKPSPKYHKTMGAPTNTVECRLRPECRKVATGDHNNKPDTEFQLNRYDNNKFVFYKQEGNVFHLDPEFEQVARIEANNIEEMKTKYFELIEDGTIKEGNTLLLSNKYFYDNYIFKEVKRFKICKLTNSHNTD